MRSDDFAGIRPVSSLQEFFRNSVAEAMVRQGVKADDHTAYYVVNLLTLFARSEALFDQTENGIELKPLAKVLADSLEAELAAERRHALQRIGDVALFVAGFLSDSLATRPVDVDYYIRMGGSAYGALSESVRGSLRGQVFATVFAELADKFQGFVDVLNEVKTEASAETDIDVLRTYEVWLRTGSERAARLLRRQGIEPQRAVTFRTQH
jgi:hypothetical protein